MDALNRKLLSDALYKVDLEIMERDLKNCKKSACISMKNAKKMSDALGIHVHWHPSAKQIVAILIAAAILALTGCGVIYRNEIRDFVVHFYETYIKVEFSNDHSSNSNSDVSYSFEYLPDGFVKDEEESDEMFIVWKNESDQTIKLSILKIDKSMHYIDTEYGDVETKIIGNKKIMVYKNERYYTCIWNDEYKAFRLKVFGNVPEQEIIYFIEGIKTN